MPKQKIRILVLIVIVIITGFTLLLIQPIKSQSYLQYGKPIENYDQAVLEVKNIQSKDTEDINDLCKTRFLDHGEKASKVIVLLHGYTNCPQQFEELGKQLHAKGYNVLIPRLPYHGLKDRMTDNHKNLTANELKTFGDEVVNIAQGLGEEVNVMGLSGTGVLTSWLALNRHDIDKAILIAPSFAHPKWSKSKNLAMTNLGLVMPNQLKWWDDETKNATYQQHAYPKYATKSLAEISKLSYEVMDKSITSAPKNKVVMIINESDKAVNNELNKNIIYNWGLNKSEDSHIYTFPKDLKLDHDMIDIDRPTQKTGEVYPKLILMIEN